MAFWSTQRVEHKQAVEGLLEPFEPGNLHQGAYELTLSQQAVTTTSEKKGSRIRGQPMAFVIAPGHFAILYSHETVRVPVDTIAFISVKSSFKADGLINISGFHVDPGYEGQLRFSVYNAGSQPVVLKLGSPTFQIWFADLDAPTRDPYEGAHQLQRGLTTNDLAMTLAKPASPAVLAQRIDKLELKLKYLSGAYYTVLVALFACLLGLAFTALLPYLQAKASAPAKQGTSTPPPSARP